MTDHSERETLITDAKRWLYAYSGRSGTREPAIEAGAIIHRLLAALDGGAVSQDARFLLDRLSEIDFSLSPDDFAREWDGHVTPAIARLSAALRTPPQQDEARDLLIRFAIWFDRCSERPLHAHEISDSIDAFLAAEKEPK